jgi:hypothetical protein
MRTGVHSGGTGNRPAFPHANGFNGLLRALPGDEFLFVTIAPQIERPRAPGWAAKTSARLDTSNGCQDHTTSPSATPSKKPLDRLGTSPAEALAKAHQRRRLARSMIAHGVDPPCDIVAPDAAASTASRSNVRDDREAPLMRDGMAWMKHLIWGWSQEDF